jgi:glycosyltransferase involved in cell wall biosynthesis
MVTAFPEDVTAPSGGVESSSVTLAAALGRRSDVELHVVTTEKTVRVLAIEVAAAYTVHRIPWSGGTWMTRSLTAAGSKLSRYVVRLKPDVVHLHGVYASLVKTAFPSVFTPHGIIHRDTRLSGKKAPWLRALAWKELETRTWRRQDHVIFLNSHVRAEVEPYVSGSWREIPNAVDSALFDSATHGGPDGDTEGRTVLSLANFVPLKNTLAVVEAFAKVCERVPDAQLVLAGSRASEGYLAQVRAAIAGHGLEPSVRIHLGLDRPGIRRELARAAVFCLLSRVDSAPVAVSEAMACGLPVVASHVGGLPQMVEHGGSGYLVSLDEPVEAAGRMVELLTNETMRRSLGSRGRELALERYHPDSVAAATVEFYGAAQERGTALRACVVAPSLTPDILGSAGHVGGAELNLVSLSTELARLQRGGVTLLGGPRRYAGEGGFDGVSYRPLSYYDPARYRRIGHKIMRRLLLWQALFATKADALITSTAGEHALHTLLVAKLRGKVFVYRMAHDRDLSTAFFAATRSGRVLHGAFRALLPWAGAIVCQHELQVQGLPRSLRHRAVVIGNAIPRNGHREEGADRKDGSILWVSRCRPWKRSHLLLQLAERIPERRFVMIMQGSGAEFESVRARAATLPNVDFRAGVSFAETEHYFARAVCFVNTSESEGFPNSFLQAWRSGTAVLSFRVDPGTVIERHGLGFVCHDDLDEAMRFCRSLDRHAIAAFSKRCREYVREHHDPVRVANEYSALIRSLA